MDLNQLVNRVMELELIVKKMDYSALKTLADATATLDAGDLVDGGLFSITPTAARAITTPTAAIIQSAMVPKPVIGDSFKIYINVAAAFDVTLTAGANVSVYDGIINNEHAAYLFIMDSATTFKVYRLF